MEYLVFLPGIERRMDTLRMMQDFVRVVETGSFSAVATEQSTRQATISKRVAALEDQLGSRLLVRGSRNHTLTETGQSYFERCVRILSEIDEAESEARSLTSTPTGKLRITIPTMFGSLYIAPIIPEFLAMHPHIKLDVQFTEKKIDLIEGGIDIAIRIGELEDSSLIARKLGDDDLILVASPDYLTKFGEPNHPKELKDHNCLIFSLSKQSVIWSFTNKDSKSSVHVDGNFRCDTGSGLNEMLLANAGIAFMPNWLVADLVEAGKLTHILKDYYKTLPINALYPHNRYVPLKTKCFLEFIRKAITTHPNLK